MFPIADQLPGDAMRAHKTFRNTGILPAMTSTAWSVSIATSGDIPEVPDRGGDDKQCPHFLLFSIIFA
jgi:hypothetical protein